MFLDWVHHVLMRRNVKSIPQNVVEMPFVSNKRALLFAFVYLDMFPRVKLNVK